MKIFPLSLDVVEEVRQLPYDLFKFGYEILQIFTYGLLNYTQVRKVILLLDVVWEGKKLFDSSTKLRIHPSSNMLNQSLIVSSRVDKNVLNMTACSEQMVPPSLLLTLVIALGFLLYFLIPQPSSRAIRPPSLAQPQYSKWHRDSPLESPTLSKHWDFSPLSIFLASSFHGLLVDDSVGLGCCGPNLSWIGTVVPNCSWVNLEPIGHSANLRPLTPFPLHEHDVQMSHCAGIQLFLPEVMPRPGDPLLLFAPWSPS